MDNHLSPLHGLAQPVFKDDPLKGPVAYRGIVELIIVPALVLCEMQGDIGVLEKRRCILAVFGIEADADAGGKADFVMIDDKRFIKGLHDLVRNSGSILGPVL